MTVTSWAAWSRNHWGRGSSPCCLVVISHIFKGWPINIIILVENQTLWGLSEYLHKPLVNQPIIPKWLGRGETQTCLNPPASLWCWVFGNSHGGKGNTHSPIPWVIWVPYSQWRCLTMSIFPSIHELPQSLQLTLYQVTREPNRDCYTIVENGYLLNWYITGRVGFPNHKFILMNHYNIWHWMDSYQSLVADGGLLTSPYTMIPYDNHHKPRLNVIIKAHWSLSMFKQRSTSIDQSLTNIKQWMFTIIY